METKEKKQTTWEWNETEMKFKAIYPTGYQFTLDMAKLINKETWLSLKENVRFVILYGTKQIVSDRSNMATNDTARATIMEKVFGRILANDLARTSGIRQTATKKLATIEEILNSDMTAEQKNLAIMELVKTTK